MLALVLLASLAWPCDEIACIKLCAYLGEKGSFNKNTQSCVCGREVSFKAIEVRPPVIHGEPGPERIEPEPTPKERPRQWWED